MFGQNGLFLGGFKFDMHLRYEFYSFLLKKKKKKKNKEKKS